MPEIIAQNLVQAMEKTMGYEFCVVVAIDENTQLLMPLAMSRHGTSESAHAQEIGHLKNFKKKADQSLVGWAIQHKRILRVGDVRDDSRYVAIQPDVRSELCVPLLAAIK